MASAAALPATEVVGNNPKRKVGRGRKPLKDISANEANISAGKTSSAAETDGLDTVLSPRKSKVKSKAVAAKSSFADDLEELQTKLNQLRIEKEKTEELLKERDEMLKQKEEELENRGKEQERLQKELKKLQNLKEFKPSVNFPIFQSLREKEQEKKQAKRKSKDGAEKRKPCPAYVLWCKDQWNEVKKASPDAEFKKISNILGAKWKNLGAEEKKPYEEKYQKEKEAYLLIIGQEKRENEAMKLLEEEQMQKTAMELMEQYLQFRQETEKESKKTRKEKDPLKPKQPMSAFFLFARERRAALLEQHKNVLEISKIAGEEWKSMDDRKRAPFEEMARKQKEEYLRQMEIYKQKKSEEAETQKEEEEEQKKVLKQEALQLLKKKEKTENMIKQAKETRQKKKHQKGEKNSDPNKPKKPASSFLLFSKEARKSILMEKSTTDSSTLNAMASVKWKGLSEAERRIWNDRAAEAMQAYKWEMEEYQKNKSQP